MLPISGIVDRYLARQIVLGVVGTIAVLTPLVWLMQVLHLLPLLSRQGVSFLSFLWMILLILPGLVEIILPVAVFIAILVTYSRAMADRELTVMLASGRSPPQLSRPATFITGACILLSYLLTLVIVPYSARHIHHLQQSLRSQGAVLLLQDGVFFNIMPGLTVYVRQKDSNGELHGLLINDERQPGHSSTVLARHGVMIMKDTCPYWSCSMAPGRKSTRIRAIWAWCISRRRSCPSPPKASIPKAPDPKSSLFPRCSTRHRMYRLRNVVE